MKNLPNFRDFLLESNKIVTLGEPVYPEDFPDPDTVLIPVILDGKEISTDEISLLITPFEKDGQILYRPDINLYKWYQHQGLGYQIYLEFLRQYGNLMSYDKFRINNKEIPKIYDKLSKEPGINVEKTSEGIFAYTDEWVRTYNKTDIQKQGN